MLYQYDDLVRFRETLWEAEKLRLPDNTIGAALVLLMRECQDELQKVRAKDGNPRIMPVQHQAAMEEFHMRVSIFRFLQSLGEINGHSVLLWRQKKKRK